MRTAIRSIVALATILALLAPAATLVSAAGITASPGTGAIGTTTNVSGSGFAANTTVRVFFNGSGGSLVGAESSDGSGNLAGFNVEIPSVVAGTYQIFATDGTNTATTTFAVPSALTLTPSSGGQGTGVTVNGQGFLSGEGISVAWDQAGNQVATATANSNGVFSTSFSVPSSSGMHTVLATGQSSHFVLSATFSVSGNVGGANLSVNPTSGAAGSTVTLSGSGFSANEQVNIAVDNGGTMSVTADGSGNFSTSMTLSSSLALGAHTISATGASSGQVALQRSLSRAPPWRLHNNRHRTRVWATRMTTGPATASAIQTTATPVRQAIATTAATMAVTVVGVAAAMAMGTIRARTTN